MVIDGRYRVIRPISEASRFAIFLVEDIENQAELALKTFAPRAAPVRSDNALQSEFLLLHQFHHPHIVRPHEFGICDHHGPYFTMGFSGAETLLSLRGILAPADLQSILLQIGDALDHIGRRGVLHRDISPANIVVRLEEEAGPHAYLIDFGMASFAQTGHEPLLSGTPSYIAPEILEGRNADHRSDIYSLGMTLLACLPGAPGSGQDATTIIVHPMDREENPGTTDGPLTSTLRRMTERSPQSRLSCLEELPVLLNPGESTGPPSRSRAFLRESLAHVPSQGREEIQSLLMESLRDWAAPDTSHRRRSSRIFLVGGEAGIGKTRLLKETAIRAQTLGFRTLLSGCTEHGGSPLESLRGRFPQCDAAPSLENQCAVPPEHAALVWTIPTPPTPRTLSGNNRERDGIVSRQPGNNSLQLRTLHTLAQRIQLSSSGHPLLLAFEDIQWADRETLELIRFLSVQQDGPVIIATYQTDRPPAADLETFIGYLSQRENTANLLLDRLDTTATRDYLASVLGPDAPNQKLAEVLQNLTGGNPLLLAETLSSLINSELIARRSGHWEVRLDEIHRCDLPKNLTDFAQAQLEVTSPRHRRLLEVLAALDAPASHFLVATLCQRELASVQADLEALVAMTVLVRLRSSQESRYAFRHRCIREYIYHEIPASRRREIHRVIANRLEAESMATGDSMLEQIAHHYCEAMDQEKGPSFAFRAAYQALEHSSTDRAISLFLKGLDLVQRQDTALRFEGLEAVSALLMMRGDAERAARFYQEMQLLARMTGEPAKEALAIRETSRVLIESGDVIKGLAYAQDAAARYRDLGDASGEIASVVLWAFALQRQGDSEAAELLASEAYDRAAAVRDLYGQSFARTTQGLIACALGNYDDALRYQKDALRFKTTLNDVVGMTVALNNIGLVHLERNDLAAARECFDRALRDAREKGFALAATLAAGNLGEIFLLTGDPTTAESLITEALALAEGSNRRYYTAYCLCHLGCCAALRGFFSRSLAILNRSESLFSEIGARPELSLALIAKSELLGLLGRREEAEKAARDALCIAFDLGNPAPIALARGSLAHLLLMGDDTEAAHMLITDQHIDEARKRVPTHGFCRMLEARAAVDLARERPAQALTRLHELKSLAREAGLRPDVARAALIEGQALLRLGRRNEARILLEQETVNAREMGLRPLLSHLLLQLAKAQETLDDTAGAADSSFEAAELVRSLAEEITDHSLRDQYLHIPANAAILQHAESLARKGIRPRPAAGAVDPDPDATAASAFEEISRRLGADAPLRRLLTAALDKAIESIRADRGMMILFDPASAEVTIARNLEGETLNDATEYCRSILGEVAEGRSILAIDVPGDQRFSSRRSVTLYQILSLMCIPLKVEGRLVGALYFDSRSGDRLFRQEDLRLMEAFSARAAAAIAEVQESRKLRDRAVVINQELAQRYHVDNLIGVSQAMQRLFRMMESVIRADCNVLLMGESGTGKELVARAIHYAGARKLSNFVPLDCGAVPENLIESELFGFRRGAFSGAESDKKGLLEEADSGSLFLDEITNTSSAFQAKLLRALQSGEFRRLGETTLRRVDVRIIAATNTDIELAIKEGRFREDLYYRLNVVTLQLPPLRERPEDIPLLAEHFARRVCEGRDIPYLGISEGAMARLAAYHWPGNIRELEHAIEAALVVSEDGLVRREALPGRILGGNIEAVSDLLRENGRSVSGSAAGAPGDERSRVEAALHQAGGDKSHAARLLGWNRMRLYRRLRSLGIPYDLASDAD